MSEATYGNCLFKINEWITKYIAKGIIIFELRISFFLKFKEDDFEMQAWTKFGKLWIVFVRTWKLDENKTETKVNQK